MKKTAIAIVLFGLVLFGSFIPTTTIADDFCHEDATFTDVPIGQIFMWYQPPSKLPYGWYVCNATNNALNGSVPVLESRFIVGYDEYVPIGDTGGSKEVVLALGEIPSHSHNAPTDIVTGLSFRTESVGSGLDSVVRTISSTSDTQLSRSVGESKGHENRPMFKTVYYVIYMGV